MLLLKRSNLRVIFALAVRKRLTESTFEARCHRLSSPFRLDGNGRCLTRKG